MINLPLRFSVSTKGQATLLAILIATAVAVVTAVGVTTRQNSSFRRTTYTTQTDQAFSCANSGVDKALLCITEKEKLNLTKSQIISQCTVTTFQALAGAAGNNICSYSYTLSDLTDNPLKINPLNVGQVQQLNSTGLGSMTITWQKSDTTSSLPDPGLEITYASFVSPSTYSMKKFAFTCNNGNGGTSLNGFNNVNSGANGCTTTINGLDSGATESLVRIKALFNSANLSVGTNGVSQGIKIKAVGQAGGTIRNIEVFRLNPQLPALFDYVLYSEEGDIKK